MWANIFKILGGILFGGGGYLLGRELFYKLKGKRIAVLGEREVGKTVLINFLTNGEIPKRYEQTVGSKKTKRNNFKLGTLSLRLKESLDVSGSSDAYGTWKSIYQEADIVLYLMRADRVKEGNKETVSRVEKDLKHIRSWQDEADNEKEFLLVGTFCDKDPRFSSEDKGEIGTYHDEFRGLPHLSNIRLLAGKHGGFKLFLGSLKDATERKRLVLRLLEELTS